MRPRVNVTDRLAVFSNDFWPVADQPQRAQRTRRGGMWSAEFGVWNGGKSFVVRRQEQIAVAVVTIRRGRAATSFCVFLCATGFASVFRSGMFGLLCESVEAMVSVVGKSHWIEVDRAIDIEPGTRPHPVGGPAANPSLHRICSLGHWQSQWHTAGHRLTVVAHCSPSPSPGRGNLPVFMRSVGTNRPLWLCPPM